MFESFVRYENGALLTPESVSGFQMSGRCIDELCLVRLSHLLELRLLMTTHRYSDNTSV